MQDQPLSPAAQAYRNAERDYRAAKLRVDTLRKECEEAQQQLAAIRDCLDNAAEGALAEIAGEP